MPAVELAAAATPSMPLPGGTRLDDANFEVPTIPVGVFGATPPARQPPLLADCAAVVQEHRPSGLGPAFCDSDSDDMAMGGPSTAAGVQRSPGIGTGPPAAHSDIRARMRELASLGRDRVVKGKRQR